MIGPGNANPIVRSAIARLWGERFPQALPAALTNRDALVTLIECGVFEERYREAVRAEINSLMEP